MNLTITTPTVFQLAVELSLLSQGSPELKDLMDRASSALLYLTGERDAMSRERGLSRNEGFSEGFDQGWNEAAAAAEVGPLVDVRPTRHGSAVRALRAEIERMEEDPEPDVVTRSLVASYEVAIEVLARLDP